MKTYQIYILRHGMTEGNLKGQYIGRTDLPVLPEGEKILLAMREKYIYPDADLFYTSPLTRCRQTLELLYPEASPIVVPDLTECDFGAFEGKTPAELKDDPDYQTWTQRRDPDAAPPGGESTAVFFRRVCMAFNRIVENMLREGKTRAVVCTHGGVIMSVLSAYGLPQRSFLEWDCKNGQGYALRVTPGVWMRGGMFEVIGTLPLERIPENPDGSAAGA